MSLSGQKTVTTAGTAVAMAASSAPVGGAVAVKALLTNTGTVYVGGSDVEAANGLPLAPGEVAILVYVGDLATLFVDSAVNGEGVAWLQLDV